MMSLSPRCPTWKMEVALPPGLFRQLSGQCFVLGHQHVCRGRFWT